jgi:hypothetical protein
VHGLRGEDADAGERAGTLVRGGRRGGRGGRVDVDIGPLCREDEGSVMAMGLGVTVGAATVGARSIEGEGCDGVEGP